MDQTELWKQALATLQLSISPANFGTWFTGTKIVRVEDGTVEVGCPSSFNKAWLQERYRPEIAAVLEAVLKKPVKVSFTTLSTPPKPTKSAPAPLFDLAEEEKRKTLQRTASAGLNPRYTLDNFVVGNNNQLAYAIAQAIVASPGKVYNPFFLYGGVGVGKTHLMQSVGHALLKEAPEKSVVYCTGEAFTNEMIEAIQNKRTSAFRSRYRGVDLLLIDDIQFIAGRDSTQEEFFHTFNALHGSGRQVVMTSDRPPKDIAKLEDRLRSRFEWGMIADIQPPDKDMRVAILSFKCKEAGVELPFEVADFLAGQTASVRDLEGALMRLVTNARLSGSPITLDLARQVIGVAQEPARRKAINPKVVLDNVAQEFEVKVSDIRGARRYKELVVPRQVAMYILRNDFSLPLMRVAEMLGGRDHTTVMHGVERCEKMIERDQTVKERVEAIRDRLYG